VNCPFCRNVDSRVVDSRSADDGTSIRRRRQCPECGRRFSTVETASLTVVKRSGATEPFSRAKIISGVRKACQGRPVGEDERGLDLDADGGGPRQQVDEGRGSADAGAQVDEDVGGVDSGLLDHAQQRVDGTGQVRDAASRQRGTVGRDAVGAEDVEAEDAVEPGVAIAGWDLAERGAKHRRRPELAGEQRTHPVGALATCTFHGRSISTAVRRSSGGSCTLDTLGARLSPWASKIARWKDLSLARGGRAAAG